MTIYARVAVPRPLYRTFLYRVPDSLAGTLAPGCRVIVPFRRRELTGWVDQLVSEPADRPSGIREILDAPDTEPALSTDILDLCRWVARYYIAPLGLVFRAALPAQMTSESAERLQRRPGAQVPQVSLPERTLLTELDRFSGPVKLSTLRRRLGPGPWSRTAQLLADRGVVELVREAPTVARQPRQRQVVHLTRDITTLQERDRLFGRARRQRELYEYLESVGGTAEAVHISEGLGISRSVIHGLVERGLAALLTEDVPLPWAPAAYPAEAPHKPTPAQRDVLEKLLRAANRQPPGTFVLKGVTGSGKTLVYIELLKQLVGQQKRGAIVLVPEISLTPQTLGRFRAAFGDDVVLLHSALSDGERLTAWRSLRTGSTRIVIGARSAVFAPVQNLGAIIIDEEHESSYKQSDQAPRYHAREVAVVRARRANALCLLGSATPSLESWWNTSSGTWELLELPERIGARPLPAVDVVDLREEARRAQAAGGGQRARSPVLSERLRQALARRLSLKEQAILLLNRRGYANFVQCRDCGSVRSCRSCNVSLTHHRQPPRLWCHHCGHQEAVPHTCPECGSDSLSFRGIGTEQVERVLGEHFAELRVARMDVDTTSGKWSHHQILERVERREVDVLLGTQMIAKGLDYPNVTLVGVVNADTGINLPDFRASERTFQLLTQVAGRAGRGPAGGEVIIQTAMPAHYAVGFAINHDYEGFAAREIDERADPAYPPHTRLTNVVFSARNELQAQEAAETARRWLDGLLRTRRIIGIDLVGPAPCPIDRLRRRWRWHLVLKSTRPDPLGRVMSYFAERFEPGAGDVRVEIDRDPVSLL